MPSLIMATLLPELSSDEEENNIKTDSEDDEQDEVNHDFEFGGILVCDLNFTFFIYFLEALSAASYTLSSFPVLSIFCREKMVACHLY